MWTVTYGRVCVAQLVREHIRDASHLAETRDDVVSALGCERSTVASEEDVVATPWRFWPPTTT